MEMYQIVFIFLAMMLGILFVTILTFSKMVKKDKISFKVEKLGGVILFIICILCGLLGVYTFMDMINGLILSLTFFGISIVPLHMTLGKTEREKD